LIALWSIDLLIANFSLTSWLVSVELGRVAEVCFLNRAVSPCARFMAACGCVEH